MRLIRLNTVVLPAPFGPMMVNTSPSFTSKPTPSTAFTPPKAIERFSTRGDSRLIAGAPTS